MKSIGMLRAPDHPSYQRHRRQMWAQILVPIILATLVVAGLVMLIIRATFAGGGDVARWSAISTIWLTIIAMFYGLIILAVLCAIIVLAAYVAGLIPSFSYRTQRFFYRLEYGTKNAAAMVHKPVLFLHGAAAAVKAGVRTAWKRLR